MKRKQNITEDSKTRSHHCLGFTTSLLFLSLQRPGPESPPDHSKRDRILNHMPRVSGSLFSCSYEDPEVAIAEPKLWKLVPLPMAVAPPNPVAGTE